jgi:hypothetical protein
VLRGQVLMLHCHCRVTEHAMGCVLYWVAVFGREASRSLTVQRVPQAHGCAYYQADCSRATAARKARCRKASCASSLRLQAQWAGLAVHSWD